MVEQQAQGKIRIATALGYVVMNISALYRMRYAFWILLIVMAASTIQCIRKSRVFKLPVGETR